MTAGIAVVGSLMMDLVVRAPGLPQVGESLLAHDLRIFVGGKGGNQALAALRAGAGPVSIIGRVGQDAFGDQIVETLESNGLDCRQISRDPEVGTGVAVPIVFDDEQNSIFAIPRANLQLSDGDIDAAADTIRSARMLLVQFEVSMAATVRAMEIAREAGVRVLLNPAPIAPHPPEILALATYLVVNEVVKRHRQFPLAQTFRSLCPSVGLVHEYRHRHPVALQARTTLRKKASVEGHHRTATALVLNFVRVPDFVQKTLYCGARQLLGIPS